MNADYIETVDLFAPAGRLTDEKGKPFNISHQVNIDPAKVRTDGRGNVVDSPLIWRKPCFGRLERYVRGHTGFGVWQDHNGQRRPNPTPCDSCAAKSPGVHEACALVTSERRRSNPAIDAAFDAWTTACGDYFGPRCFIGHRAVLWRSFLQSIRNHGGWSNVNDDQVKLEALRLRKDDMEKRKLAAKVTRNRTRHARRGTAKRVTQNYLQALQSERDQRAAKVKSLCGLTGKTAQSMLWLTNLPVTTCDRIADVWSARELIIRCGRNATGKAMAEQMTCNGRNYGLNILSLTSRIYEDLKRIARLEDDRAGPPLWVPWTYTDPGGTP